MMDWREDGDFFAVLNCFYVGVHFELVMMKNLGMNQD